MTVAATLASRLATWERAVRCEGGEKERKRRRVREGSTRKGLGGGFESMGADNDGI